MIYYQLGAGETIVCASTDYAERRLRTICGRSLLVRLIPKPSVKFQLKWFIVLREHEPDIRRVRGLETKERLKAENFESMVDETKRSRRRAKAARAEQLSLFK